MNENYVLVPVAKNGLMAFLFNACASRLNRLRGERKTEVHIFERNVSSFDAETEEQFETVENEDDELNDSPWEGGLLTGGSKQIQQIDHDEKSEKGSTAGSSLSAYLRVVYAVPKMSIAEEKGCFERYKNGDIRARDDLICANLWLVPLVVRRMAHGTVSLEELVEEGNFGIFKALERFDPTIGVRFATYAKWWIVQAASQTISANAYPVRLPSSVAKDLARLKKAKRAEDVSVPGKLSNVHEAQRAHGWTDNYLNLLSSISEPPLSIDASEDHHDLIHSAALNTADSNAQSSEPDAMLSFKQSLSRLSHLIDELDERSRFILINRFGLGDERPMTLQEVGDHLGLSAERVRVIQDEVIGRLKHDVTASV
jgi:RNA polymerase primary sigma factor